jgi:hypothetical protein
LWKTHKLDILIGSSPGGGIESWLSKLSKSEKKQKIYIPFTMQKMSREY